MFHCLFEVVVALMFFVINFMLNQIIYSYAIFSNVYLIQTPASPPCLCSLLFFEDKFRVKTQTVRKLEDGTIIKTV